MRLEGVQLTRERMIVLGVEIKPKVRTFEELLPVLMSPELVRDRLSVAYYMFRDLPHLRESWARFDVTLIPPWRVGKEFAKTHGHYHLPGAAGIPYPEIYQVLEGKGLFLLQEGEGNRIKDFVYLRGEPGDVIIIPPGYGHVTVNPGEEPLIMSNIIYRLAKSDYGPFKSLRGAAYYYTVDGFLRNSRYEEAPSPREVKPLSEDVPIVDSFLKRPADFEWLRRPELMKGNPLE